jgi:hypothetical protein
MIICETGKNCVRGGKMIRLREIRETHHDVLMNSKVYSSVDNDLIYRLIESYELLGVINE